MTTGLAILTWNLNGSTGVDAAAVAAVVNAAAADIVVLQEVQRRQAVAIAGRLGATDVRWAFKHWPVLASPEGLAVLTRHDLESSRAVTITHRAPWSWRRRIVLVARVATPLGSVTVADAHLSPHGEVRRREAEAQRVLAELAADVDRPAFVVGDLNDPPGGGAHRVFCDAGYRDGWAEAHGDEPGATNWTHGDRRGRPPTQRLDHVLVPPGWEVDAAAVGPGAPVESFAPWSDHLPLVVTVRRGPSSVSAASRARR